MAFTQSTFSPVGPQSTDAPTIYSYKTLDINSSIVATEYFYDKRHQLEDGDVIIANTADAGNFNVYQVLPDTSSAELVSSEGGSTFKVESFVSTGTINSLTDLALSNGTFTLNMPTSSDSPITIKSTEGTTTLAGGTNTFENGVSVVFPAATTLYLDGAIWRNV
jgi:hypothetical protein